MSGDEWFCQLRLTIVGLKDCRCILKGLSWVRQPAQIWVVTLRLRCGAGSDSDDEHHITDCFKQVDRELEDYGQKQARQRDC